MRITTLAAIAALTLTTACREHPGVSDATDDSGIADDGNFGSAGNPGDVEDTGTEADADTDADSDTDTDSDSDADSDTDSDSDTDADAGYVELCLSNFAEDIVLVELWCWNTTTWDQDGLWVGEDDHFVVGGTTQSELCGDYAGPKGTSPTDDLECTGYAYDDDGNVDWLTPSPYADDAYASLAVTGTDQVCLVQDNNGGGGEWGCSIANGDNW